MVYLFWVASIFLVYTFVGYPLVLWILSLLRPRVHRKGSIRPTVSLITVAHNEAKVIGSKILNTLELIYPEDKREIIVVSDASEDGTPAIVHSFSDRGVKLVEVPERRGKHHGQMVARDASHGEILIFSDAAVFLETNVLEKIVSNFADSSIGCVSSEDRVVEAKKTWIGEESYIQFEMWLRRLESRVGSLVNVSGSFFAARREVCEKWHPQQSSDFFLALHSAARGLRSVVDPECRGYYGLVRSKKAEFQRKIRTIVHGIDLLSSHLGLLNPFRYGLFSWQLMSHKLFRWLMPFAILGVLASNPFLWSRGLFYRICLTLQGVLYASGLLALAVNYLSRFRPFKLASFFLLGTAATLIAWLKFCFGETYVTWEPSRRV